mgnify:CR=1 FL=1
MKEVKELDNALDHAETDPVTRLLNTRALIDGITRRLSDPEKKYALFLIDLDNFKTISDVFGHAIGDRILRSIADRIVEAASWNDLAGRVGDDGFVLFAGLDSDEGNADIIAQKICDAISSVKIRAEFGESDVTGSVGIALAPCDGTDYDALVAKAGQSISEAGKNGKNPYVF